MKKMFQRMVAEKVHCNIEFKITSIVLNVHQPLILKLRWKRGPQTDVSPTFEVNSDANTYELNFNFERASTFYYCNNEFQRKECMIELIYSSVGHEAATGSVMIDMAPFVGKGPVYSAFKLTDQTVTQNTQVNAFFNIYALSSTSKEGSEA